MIRSYLWQLIKKLVRCCPERLRLAFLEQPLIIPLDYTIGVKTPKIVAHSSEEYYIRARSAAKEPELVEWIRQMPEDAIFVDVGANVGTYSLIAGFCHHERTVISIEPSALNYASLCMNITHNECSNIFPVAVALGHQLRACSWNSYYHPSLQPGASLFSYWGWDDPHISQPQSWRSPYPGLRGGVHVSNNQYSFMLSRDYNVWTISLDELWPQLGFAPPTHMKIDVDNCHATKDILEGAWKTLKTVTHLVVESDEPLEIPGFKWYKTGSSGGKLDRNYFYWKTG